MLGICDFCYQYREVCKAEEGGLSICSDCDTKRIEELQEEWENEPCTCTRFDPWCGHPLCHGYLT